LADQHQTLLRLATGDDTATTSASGRSADARLDDKAVALVRIGALVALGASTASFLVAIQFARASGASVEEVLGTLVAVSTTVGLARVVDATPAIGLGLGYDIDAALQD
jgi:alkylhydroperoxidase/carboxymuconolactone decarboxylase family protein YurZ